MKTYNILITDKERGERIDLAILHSGIDLSRKKIRAIIDAGGVYLNNKRVRIASRKVDKGDKIRLEYNLDSLKKLKNQNFAFRNEDILYFKDGIIAVNKPPGLPSQATLDQSVIHVIPCLEQYFVSKNEKPPRFVLVHRLDKETSGVILLATQSKVGEELGNLFRNRTIDKTYHAIVYGIPKEKAFHVECYLSDIDRKVGLVRQVRSGGKSSYTDFEVLAENEKHNLALVRCKPRTGRSHQIRVHLDIYGSPIVGDKRYGRVDYARFPKELVALVSDYHFLHAQKLEFTHPTVGTDIKLEAPYPANFAQFCTLADLVIN
jgi:RluA family pseudouridine synthase